VSWLEGRTCRSCYGAGEVVADAILNEETGELVEVIAWCPICKGAGVVPVEVYGRSDVRRLHANELQFLAWGGTAREKGLAEKELRRREGVADSPLIDDD
jgi:hypothetical protein